MVASRSLEGDMVREVTGRGKDTASTRDPEGTSQTFMVESREAVRIHRESMLKCRAVILYKEVAQFFSFSQH